MVAESDRFEDHILSVVDRFLQTVVVVDDRAFNHSVLMPDEADSPMTAPTGGRAVQGGLQPPTTPDEHDLDAKKVTDAFARSGLICGLLEPEPGAEIDDELLQTARRADLIVVDWVLNRDEGRKALGLIQKVLNNEAGPPERQRLRTIAIYTGQSDLRQIAAQLRDVIDEVYPGEELKEHDGGLALTKGPVRAAVFAKENAPKLSSDLADRRIPFSGLPARLRREFAALTTGLVTGVALAALAALRDDTHRILKVLHPGLDAAYLGHRSVLPVPRDAESLVAALVSGEVASVIEDHDVGKEVNEHALFLWLDRPRNPKLEFGELVGLTGTEKPPISQIREMLSKGLGTEEGLAAVQRLGHASKGQWNKVKKQATRVFAHTVEVADEAEAQLVQCLTLKTIYSRPERMLQLGTIVLAPTDEYLVCVQPVCDSVRLKAEVRSFPFLRLERSDSLRSHFIVPEREPGEWQRLLLKANPRDIIVARFKPRSGDDTIRAIVVEQGYVFKNTSGKPYRWVCQLKTEFAQKVAVDLAQEFAQVAVNEAEVLRLSRR
jgi:Response receiver domain